MTSFLNSVAKLFGVSSHVNFAWEKLDKDVVNIIRDKLHEKKLSISAINTTLSAIRKTCNEAFSSKLMTADQFQRIKLIPNLKGRRVRKHRTIKSSVTKSFLKSCDDNSFKGLRDSLIYMLLIGCGLRRAECARLMLSDVDLSECELLVHGKGNKQRSVGIPKQVIEHLNIYLVDIRGFQAGPLIVKFNKDDEPVQSSIKDDINKCLTPAAINYILKKRLKTLKPHDLRAEYATALIEAGHSLNTVKDLLGHSSVTTTQIYIRHDDSVAKKASVEHVIY